MQFEDSTASDGAVGLHSISNETYLHVLRFLSVESLAKAAQTSRLGAVLSMVRFNQATDIIMCNMMSRAALWLKLVSARSAH
jgi:hypothetical protein